MRARGGEPGGARGGEPGKAHGAGSGGARGGDSGGAPRNGSATGAGAGATASGPTARASGTRPNGAPAGTRGGAGTGRPGGQGSAASAASAKGAKPGGGGANGAGKKGDAGNGSNAGSDTPTTVLAAVSPGDGGGKKGTAGPGKGPRGGSGDGSGDGSDTPTTVLAAVTPTPAKRTASSPGGAGGAATGDTPDTPTTVLAAVTPAAAARNSTTPGTGTATQVTAQAAASGGKKPKRPKRTGWRRLLPTWRMVLGTFLVGALLVIGGLVLGYQLVEIPAANAAATKQANVYLYADGSQLARDARDTVNRENVTLAQISKDAQHAVLAAEDRDFYTESAVDPTAMVRAAWNTATGKGKQSGSTITQQYVKNYYLGQEQTVSRKAKEFFIAIKLDNEKSKDEILEGYLNTSFFGRNAYGIQAAAQAYYGIDADELTAAQGAYLASLLNAPSMYDVIAHPEGKEAALARWNYVLDGMVKEGWLSQAERDKTEFPTPKQTVSSSTGMSGQRGYLVEAVKQYLDESGVLDEETLRSGGYRITTTLEKDKQDAFTTAVNEQVMDKLDKENNKVDNYVRVGGVSIDPKTGKVLAMYGGIDFTQQYINNATRRDYQVGSTFKPFVFTSAVENGSHTQGGQPITPNTIYDGTSQRPVEGWSGGLYAPENQDDVDYGDLTVTEATDKSVNSVYAQMAVDVGPERVEKTAIALGVPENTPNMDPYPAVALGTATASVLDMTEAYATLANHGKNTPYTLVAKITKNGQEITLPERKTRQAVDREAADTTTSVLRSVVQNGSGTAAQASGHPAAGKTGTAEQDKAAWFAGFTPDLATVVTVMGQDPDTGVQQPLYGAMGLPRVSGSGPPAQIWAQYTKAALEGEPVNDFDLEIQDGADVIQAPPSEPSDDAPSAPGEQETGGTATGGDTEAPGGDTGSQTPPSTDPGTGPGGGDGGTGTPGSGDSTGSDGDWSGPGGVPGPGGDTTGSEGGGSAGTGETGGPGGPADGGSAGTGDTAGTGLTAGAFMRMPEDY
ncbi:transglycosylase domain-containing protein [Streptomyces roseiscleroticus]|uniref:transglycosylase domain-containing protein n=1 Tax=Streptomyces TaxID=1883 RepID=UPI001E4E9832|nr:transglycosylase domain-containing protein [Streptomyces ruber]